MLRYFNEHLAFFRIFYTAAPGGRAHLPSNLRGDALEAYLDSKALAVKSVHAGQAKGLFRKDVSASELVEFTDAVLVVTLARWSLEERPPSSDAQFDLLWKLVTGGLGAREAVR